MRLPNSAHTSRPWRIRELCHDFRLEDVWELRLSSDPSDFHRAVELFAAADPRRHASWVVRLLFAVRAKLGELFGWDDEREGVGASWPTLRDRLPVDLRAAPGPEFAALPARSLYLLDDEFAAEAANRTAHGVIHLGRVQTPSGEYRAQLAIYVQPNGALGKAYMAAIKPFRHVLVYPRVLREWERQLRAGPTKASPAVAT